MASTTALSVASIAKVTASELAPTPHTTRTPADLSSCSDRRQCGCCFRDDAAARADCYRTSDHPAPLGAIVKARHRVTGSRPAAPNTPAVGPDPLTCAHLAGCRRPPALRSSTRRTRTRPSLTRPSEHPVCRALPCSSERPRRRRARLRDGDEAGRGCFVSAPRPPGDRSSSRIPKGSHRQAISALSNTLLPSHTPVQSSQITRLTRPYFVSQPDRALYPPGSAHRLPVADPRILSRPPASAPSDQRGHCWHHHRPDRFW